MELISNYQWEWEDVCGPPGLQPWNETSKDFGMCFQELFLQVPVYFLIALVSGYFIGFNTGWVIRAKTQERAVVLRSFVVLALVFIPIIQLYVFITDVSFVLYPVDYFASGAACLAWLVHFGYVLALKNRLGASARGPTIEIFLWSITVLLTMSALRTNILNSTPVACAIANLCCHGLYFLTLLPSSESRPIYYSPCLVGAQHSHSEYTPLLPHMNEGVLGTAMQGSSWWAILTFTWVNPLLQKGLENKLNDPEELFDIPGKYRCSYVGARMDRALIGNVDEHQQFTEVPHQPFIGSGYGSTGQSGMTSTPVTPTSRVLIRSPKRHNVSLLRAMHSCFAFQFYSIGMLKLISDMAGFAGPLLLNKLVTFVQDPTIDQHYGYIYAAGLFGSTLVSAVCIVHFNWMMSLVGLKMRGALISTILRKTLSVSSTTLTNAFSVGEITNFMSTDTDRIINSCPSFHALWSIPLQLFITLFLLYSQVGISFLAGVMFSVLLIPINKVIANKIGHLSTEMMKHKDTRVSLMSELLKGILTIKVHVWEDYFIDKISGARSAELRFLRGRKYLDAVCVVLWATTPVLVAALTFAAHTARGQPLDAATVFTTVALINMLIAPLNAFPWVLNGLTEAWVSIKRIQQLLDMHDTNMEEYYDRINANYDEDKAIIFRNASFAWAKPIPRKVIKSKPKSKKGKSKANMQQGDSSTSTEVVITEEPFMLQDLNLEIARGELMCVMGNVGSGKTSLLMAIIGEMLKKSGSIEIADSLNSFGYVSQNVWLVRGTIRDNILFGKPYDHAKFNAVIDACALKEDLNILGWNAYVGEGGCTLSGGQRTRIALARAVYQEKQVYLLDDVLSGLDGTVAAHVLERCVLGLLRRSTTLLVTHAARHAARAHTLLLLRDGRIHAHGPPDVVLHEVDDLPSDTESIGEEPVTARNNDVKIKKSDIDRFDDTVSRNSLEQDETMSQGSVSWWVIGLYLRSVGIVLSIIIILSLVLMQLSQNITFLWLAYWVNARTKNSTSATIDNFYDNMTAVDHAYDTADNIVHTIVNTTKNILKKIEGQEIKTVTTTAAPVYEKLTIGTTENDNYYLLVYFGLAGLNVVFTIMRAFLFAYGGVKAGTKIHKMVLRVIVKAKMKFFDVTPIGRILNRFSSDMYTVDDSLPFIMNIFLAQTFSLIGAVCVAVLALPWLLLLAAPLLLLLHYLQRRYRLSSRQLKRLQSITLSPVYAHFNDTIEGLSSVRALGGVEAWAARGDELAERWQRAAAAAAAAAAWLSARLQAAAAAAAAAAALAAAAQRAAGEPLPDAGLIGLAISYALSLTSMLSNVLSSFTETEREIIAVERLADYIYQVETEPTGGDPPPYGWPTHGVIKFENVSLQYSSGSTAALSSLSFATSPAEKLGVVGRTGAGKSSVLRALLRLAPHTGRISVDGVDLASLQLGALRARVGCIPQQPFLFAGSVRDNVDPLRQHADAEVARALAAAGAAAAAALAAPARGLSRGGAQLLCVARVLLQRHKVVGMDEATGSLDAASERLVLGAVRGALARCTVVLVAHRPAAVLDCDRALLLAGGRLLELRPPRDALADPASCLYRLLHPDTDHDHDHDDQPDH